MLVYKVMRKSKKLPKKIVKVREDDVTVVEIEIDQAFIEKYKKETGRNRVTDKGLSSFIENLIKIHQS